MAERVGNRGFGGQKAVREKQRGMLSLRAECGETEAGGSWLHRQTRLLTQLQCALRAGLLSCKAGSSNYQLLHEGAKTCSPPVCKCCRRKALERERALGHFDVDA